MSAISAADVKTKRYHWSRYDGLQKALEEASGNMDGAIDYLRKKGAKVAELRAGRDANEGCIIIKTNADASFGVMLQMGCETDFVSKNDGFVEFTNSVADIAIKGKSQVQKLYCQLILAE